MEAKLTLSQEKAAVLEGNATREQYAELLVDRAYNADDQALLLADLDTAIAAMKAKARAPVTSPAPAPAKKLTFAEEEAAFVAGLVTAAQFTAFLKAEGYSDTDAALLQSLAATKKAAATAVGGTTAVAGVAPGTKKLTVAEVDAAYLAKELTLADVNTYYQALGYGVNDRRILQQALLVKAAAKQPTTPTIA